MQTCSCEHSIDEHGSPAVFGQSLCLVPLCSCNGTDDEVVTAYVQRSMSKRRVLHDLTDTIRGVFESELTGLRGDDLAMVVASEILGKFTVEKK